MQSSNHPNAQEHTRERAKNEKEKFEQYRQEQSKDRQYQITPLYDALFTSLKVVRNSLQCTFNPRDCEFYKTTFTDSKLIANLDAYLDKAKACGLDITELDNAKKQLTALCQPSGQSIAELDVYIQHYIIDPVWSFQYHQIKHPANRLADQLKHNDVGWLHPLFLNQSGYDDVNISSENMSSHLSLKDYGIFAQAAVGTEGATAFLRLLSSAVDAEPESYKQADKTKLAAIAILKKHPELLFRKGSVKDHYGRRIWASPYQLILGTGDVWALNQVHKEIIPNIKDGEAQAQAQCREQFPYCQWPLDPKMGEEALYDDRNKEQVAQVMAQLKIIVGKITADPCTHGLATLPETTKAVEDLCQIFAPKPGEVIKTGLHFPLSILKEIYKVCDAQFDPWSGAQLSFFSRAVIGAALAASTAVDGQCCKIGLSNLNMEKGPDRRDGLFCRHPKGIPQELAPIRDKLGRTMFVDPYKGYSCFRSSSPGLFDWYSKNGGTGFDWAGWAPARSPGCWKTYGEQKQQLMGNIMRRLEEKSTHCLGQHDQAMRCVIL